MSAKSKCFFLLGLMSLAVGANAQDKFSTDWYLNHPDERGAKLLRCERNTPESVGQSCINARAAERIAQQKKRK